ncbi:MAG: GNAT family N-acetyltransferase [Myxococcota bacterium]
MPPRLQLVDGRTAEIRPIGPEDREALLALHAGLSRESRYLRYFSSRRRLPEREVRHFTEVDQRDHAGVGVWLDGMLVGHALYDRLADPAEAEVALEVTDACQGLGIGTAMLEALAALAQEAGVVRFVAHVMPTNRRMLQVLADLGFEERAVFEDGAVRVELLLAPSEGFEAARRRRASPPEPTSGD